MKITLENATNEFEYYWEDPEKITSGFCKILRYPEDSFEFLCYSFLNYEDFDHCIDEGEYGLEILILDINGSCKDSIENTWFKTKEDRQTYLNTLGHIKCIDEMNKYKKDLRFYYDDAIFYIRKDDDGECEVLQSELQQFTKNENNHNSFIRFSK